jgi:multidrug efflux system membrane fusion protein
MDADVISSEPIPPESSKPAATRAGWRRWQVVVPVLALAIIAGALKVRSLAAGQAKPAPAVRPVPVVAAPVRTGDMPVNLSGLGTVVPTDSVTVRTRVDGQIMSIHFKEGQMVRKGDLLVQVDPRPYQVQLMQAEGQLAKDQAALKNARMDLQRFQTLAGQGILSQQQLDGQVNTADQAEASVRSDLAAVENAKLNLTYSRITAPVAGKVGLRLVDTGNMVKTTDSSGLVVITPVSPINVLFTIPADNIQHVLRTSKAGKPLPVEAWDRDFNNRLASGSLLAVDNQVDTSTGTVRIKAQFANQDGALFPNQFVNAKLRTDVLHDVLTAPAAAVQRSTRGNFVYVIKADGTVDLRPVEILATEGDTLALKGQLAGGDRVVVDGQDKLRPGSKVAASEAAAKGKP